jgi:hypothetical protein
VLASADGDCGGAFVGQIAGNLQAANGAVRSRRAHIFERDVCGDYVEPLWCSARLLATESFGAPSALIFDPAAGWGRILKAARDAGYTPIGSDIVDRRSDPRAFSHFPFSICDFLKSSPVRSAWSIVCNPPFDHVEKFCERAIEIAIYKIAMLVPLRRLPAARWLERLPLESAYLLTPRPSMPPASWVATGNEPGGGTQDFCWLVFNKKATTGGWPKLRWLHRDRVQS